MIRKSTPNWMFCGVKRLLLSVWYIVLRLHVKEPLSFGDTF